MLSINPNLSGLLLSPGANDLIDNRIYFENLKDLDPMPQNEIHLMCVAFYKTGCNRVKSFYHMVT